MPKLDRANLQFSVSTFAAAMLALYLAMSIGLQRPYWALMTVYVVSQPVAAAVRSKAIYRFLGTLLGAGGALLMIPRLAQAPVLLSLAMALWVGGCLAISVLDRSPRSYILMLAGYTVALIGFPAVTHPGDIFDMAALRAQEIFVGIACATVVHSIWFPRPVGEALRIRLASWLAEADRWALDALGGEDRATLGRDRERLAGAASEIQVMATHLPFDTSRLRETTAVVQVLRDRLLMLIPILSSLADRLAALRAMPRGLDAEIEARLAQVADWIRAGAPQSASRPLLAQLERARAATTRADWHDFNRLSLLSRLTDLVRTVAESHVLLARLHGSGEPLPAMLDKKVARTATRPLHSDPGLAALSGAAAVIAILITCAVWIAAGWREGDSAAMTAAITCCLFASMDDPVPAIKLFGVYLVVAMVLGALYLFVLMPAIGSFAMLALALAPTLLGLGAMIPNPKLAFAGLTILLNLVNTLVIQDHFDADFGRFVNINLSQFFGVFAAIYVTRMLRSLSADAAARRLLRHTWRDLARLARGWRHVAPADFASRMLDRLGLLTPKLATLEGRDLSGVDTLKDLRIGMDLVALQGVRRHLSADAAADLERLLVGLGEHYQALAAGKQADDAPLLPLVDRLLMRMAKTSKDGDVRGICALVGVRRNLFPAAPAFPDVAGGWPA
ncbi:putative membrane protein [Thioflavicoccus mobilis 8321]|uniref:Putative membrane protein n=1 Tax=Thioflavicoccus mobilis 8321 TaxID=765912 RepID=L0GU46_9GAMM|nr:FUSC family protein [Thioflavicoccus mobilis]AGA89342.1 putative membrane protein [Thioflavicoccus mobilis 8321]